MRRYRRPEYQRKLFGHERIILMQCKAWHRRAKIALATLRMRRAQFYERLQWTA